MRTIDWIDGAVVLVDQTRLPGEEVYLRLDTVAELVEAIQRLRVRGARRPSGSRGALGVALAAKQYADPAELAAAVHLLETARPTAVNLARGVRRVAALLPSFDAALGEALRIPRRGNRQFEKRWRGSGPTSSRSSADRTPGC
ncbi:hypothetical protein GCM10020218_063830 [Dactylosporangium vinaceum]